MRWKAAATREQNTKSLSNNTLQKHGSHVHCHDNRGGSLDLHLPLGAGNLDLAPSVRVLKSWGYDATITLEVVSNDPNHLTHSRDVLREVWQATTVPDGARAKASASRA